MDWTSRRMNPELRLAGRTHPREGRAKGPGHLRATIARIFIDRRIEDMIAGRMDAVQASMAKYWISDLQCKVIDQCVQLFGG